ncbi:hypothetical protein RCL1_000270 [Eukaryota sp. TZLM3-RCL]
MQLSDLCIQSSLKETPSSASFLSFYNDIFYVHHIFNKTRFSPSDTSFLLDSFNSPYLFPYSHIFQDEYRYHLIREYSEFATLSSLLEPPFSSFSLSIDEIWKVSMEILLALNTLHKHSIIHGNLCLGNLLFNSSSRPIGVRVADYGLFHFRHVQDKHQSNGDFDPFKSPELYSKNHDFSYSSDYFSFGVVLYFLVFHSFPFNSKEELLNKSVTFSQESPFNKIISGLLEKDPLLRLSYIKLLQIPEVVVAFKTVHGFIPLGAKVEPKILPQSTEKQTTSSSCSQSAADIETSRIHLEVKEVLSQVEQRLHDKLSDVNKVVVSLNTGNVALWDKVNSLVEKGKELDDKTLLLQGELDKLKEHYESVDNDHSAEYKIFTQKIENVLKKITNQYEKSLGKAHAAIEALTTRNSILEEKVSKYETELERVRADLEPLLQRNHIHEKKLLLKLALTKDLPLEIVRFSVESKGSNVVLSESSCRVTKLDSNAWNQSFVMIEHNSASKFVLSLKDFKIDFSTYIGFFPSSDVNSDLCTSKCTTLFFNNSLTSFVNKGILGPSIAEPFSVGKKLFLEFQGNSITFSLPYCLYSRTIVRPSGHMFGLVIGTPQTSWVLSRFDE